ncbi:MAG: hypothetical protein R3E58_01190 [Phycisphaerae bacterium]
MTNAWPSSFRKSSASHFNDRFYPIVSGVVRTHNFYPTGPAGHEDGVANLALGLGKTIVDGGVTWTYSPSYPRHAPPYASPRDLLQNTQTQLWAVNMQPARYDPISESEYLVQVGLDDAERDDVLRHIPRRPMILRRIAWCWGSGKGPRGRRLARCSNWTMCR